MGYYFIDLIYPLCMLFGGLMLYKLPAGKPNGIYGYRTRRSMASQEAWDYANKRAGKIWLVTCGILAALFLISRLITPLDKGTLTYLHFFIGLTLLFLPVFIVEKELKSKFGK